MGNAVTIRNLTIGEGLPKICIPLTDTSKVDLIRSAKALSDSVFDFVEWRADFFEELYDPTALKDTLKALRNELGDVPVLFTIRTKEEGGQADISTEDYRKINRFVIESGLADLVDVELMKGDEIMATLVDAAKHSATSVRIVGSRHDFEKTPKESEIVESLCRMQSLGADLAKFAVMPTCEQDVLTLLSATLTMKEQHPNTPVITMSMGRLGVLSRICGTLTGSAVTFGTAGRASAPGQLPADILKNFLENLS